MNINKKNLISSITEKVEEYWNLYNSEEFDPSNPKINLHEPTFGPEEVMAMVKVMLSTRVTMGAKVLDFEAEIAEYFNVTDAITNNSGSSANLLAISALTNPATNNALRAGDEVIVPALSWSTTVWPLIQNNLIPVFVDIDPDTLNIDPLAIENAISEKTKAIMIVPVYGNPCDMDSIMKICKDFNLQLIEDSCESLGAYYDGKPLGSFGRVGTYSTYFSHHITTLEGGICMTSDFELAELMRIIRAHGWVRETKKPQKYLESFSEIDKKFLFVNLGYNLRLTEIGGAMGSVQLPKLKGFVENRRKSAKIFLDNLSQYDSMLSFQKETPKGYHSWFGFPIIVKPNSLFTANELREYLESNGIETRPIIAGNMANQPALKMYEHRISGDLKHCSNIMNNGLAVACHQSLSKEACNHIVQTFNSFFSSVASK